MRKSLEHSGREIWLPLLIVTLFLINFYAYEHYMHFLQLIPGLDRHKEYAIADVCVQSIGGGLAGITAASMTYPLGLVRMHLAAQMRTIYYRGISHAFYAICRDE